MTTKKRKLLARAWLTACDCTDKGFNPTEEVVKMPIFNMALADSSSKANNKPLTEDFLLKLYRLPVIDFFLVSVEVLVLLPLSSMDIWEEVRKVALVI